MPPTHVSTMHVAAEIESATRAAYARVQIVTRLSDVYTLLAHRRVGACSWVTDSITETRSGKDLRI